MQCLDTTWLDKAAWGDGPWQDEPDKQQFPDQTTGLPCLLLRKEDMGHWCGYVGVAPGHPLYGVPYNRCARRAAPCLELYCAHSPDAVLDVHGGITFAGACQEDPHGICHVPDPGEDAHVWWFGFDACHAGDLAPGMAAQLAQLRGVLPGLGRAPGAVRDACVRLTTWLDVPPRGERYRDVAYMTQHCWRLAQQLGDTALLARLVS